MSRRNDETLALLDSDLRLFEANRRKAPRAQALRENLQAFLNSLPSHAPKDMAEKVLLGLAAAADSGSEVDENAGVYVTGIMADVMAKVKA